MTGCLLQSWHGSARSIVLLRYTCQCALLMPSMTCSRVVAIRKCCWEIRGCCLQIAITAVVVLAGIMAQCMSEVSSVRVTSSLAATDHAACIRLHRPCRLDSQETLKLHAWSATCRRRNQPYRGEKSIDSLLQPTKHRIVAAGGLYKVILLICTYCKPT